MGGTRAVMLAIGVLMMGSACGGTAAAVPAETNVVAAVETYFVDLFDRLERVAEQRPTEKNFRALMKPEVEKIGGFYGASFINPDWEIRAVYSRSHALAVGYSLTKVKPLDAFRKKMAEKPAPQLSEPSDGGLMRPSLITMRQPVMQDGKLAGMVSLIIRTEHFLRAVGLEACTAYVITCDDVEAERKGVLGEQRKRVVVPLPSTEWTIEYE